MYFFCCIIIALPFYAMYWLVYSPRSKTSYKYSIPKSGLCMQDRVLYSISLEILSRDTPTFSSYRVFRSIGHPGFTRWQQLAGGGDMFVTHVCRYTSGPLELLKLVIRNFMGIFCHRSLCILETNSIVPFPPPFSQISCILEQNRPTYDHDRSSITFRIFGDISTSVPRRKKNTKKYFAVENILIDSFPLQLHV